MHICTQNVFNVTAKINSMFGIVSTHDLPTHNLLIRDPLNTDNPCGLPSHCHLPPSMPLHMCFHN